METFLVLMLISYVATGEALECGMDRISNDPFKKVVLECVKDNETLDKIWELASTISTEDDDNSEKEPITKAMANNLNLKSLRSKTSRSKRSKFSYNKRFNNDSSMSSGQKRQGTTEETSTMKVQSEEVNEHTNNVEDSADMCELQCIFEKLELTDSRGLPDHKKFAAALVRTAKRREIRDFLQDTADECFQQMEQEDSQNPCNYSAKLLMCLADNGKANCEDWPSGNLPF